MDSGQDLDDGQPDVDALAAEIATEIAVAFQADREELAAAAARGEKGYIQVRHSAVDTADKRARSWEEIAPLLAAQASKLREKVASLGLTAEEASLLEAAELWLQRFGPEGASGRDA
jgi:hypothetical protein